MLMTAYGFHMDGDQSSLSESDEEWGYGSTIHEPICLAFEPSWGYETEKTTLQKHKECNPATWTDANEIGHETCIPTDTTSEPDECNPATWTNANEIGHATCILTYTIETDLERDKLPNKTKSPSNSEDKMF
eukprot:16441516-Heterocapsa_arctica.AAC.1